MNYIQTANPHRPIKTVRLQYKTNQLTPLRKIIATYCENHMKHIKTLLEKAARLSVKTSCTVLQPMG
jgi:hypothetical protein